MTNKEFLKEISEMLKTYEITLSSELVIRNVTSMQKVGSCFKDTDGDINFLGISKKEMPLCVNRVSASIPYNDNQLFVVGTSEYSKEPDSFLVKSITSRNNEVVIEHY